MVLHVFLVARFRNCLTTTTTTTTANDVQRVRASPGFLPLKRNFAKLFMIIARLCSELRCPCRTTVLVVVVVVTVVAVMAIVVAARSTSLMLVPGR